MAPSLSPEPGSAGTPTDVDSTADPDETLEPSPDWMVAAQEPAEVDGGPDGGPGS